MTMTNNMACVPKAESGTKCPKMTTPSIGVFAHLYLHNQMLKEFSEKIRMLTMDTFKGGC